MSLFKLSNGKVIKKPFNRFWIILPLFITFCVIMGSLVPINWSSIRFSQLGIIVTKMFTPQNSRDWGDYFAFMLTLDDEIIDTLQMTFAGTIIGCGLAFPVAIMSARNIIKQRWISVPIKFLLNFLRTIPTLMLAALAVALVGFGILSGIAAIAVFSFGIMGKMLYEAIETVDMSPFEALESVGANKISSFRFAVLSQIGPIYISYTIYIFEINIRASAMLGYVGAGGIGSVIKDNILYDYDRVGGAVIVMFVLILIIQLLANFVRSKLQ